MGHGRGEGGGGGGDVTRDECRTTELELLQELDMLQDKNSVMRSVFGSWERRGGRGRGRCVQGRVSHDRVGTAARVGHVAR